MRCLVLALLTFIMSLPSYGNEGFSKRYVAAAKKAVDAVVTIMAQPKRDPVLGNLMEDPIFRQFFEQAPPVKTPLKPVGSGVLVASEGIVMTCYHVVRDSKNIRIRLSDDQSYSTELIAKDERNDLAVLKIKGAEAKKFPTLELGDSDKYDVAHEVLAIGNPFGVRQIVSRGIISNPAVKIGNKRLMVTDAPINPGNSGGALVDAETGVLIGFPNAILSKTGASHGIGFAIPVNVARVLLESVQKGQAQVVRPWLGISVQKISAEMAESLNVKEGGVMVKNVHSLSPLKSKGIEQGYIILEMANKTIKDDDEFDYRLQTQPMDKELALKVRNNKGDIQDIAVKLISPPKKPQSKPVLLKGNNLLNGVMVANISPYLATELGIDSTLEGVVIVGVDRVSFANRLSLQPGDVLQAFGHEKIDNVEDLVAHLRKLRHFVLTVKRLGQEIKIELR